MTPAMVEERSGRPAERRAAWLLLSPALGAIALFFAVPLIAALLLSLTDFDIYALADWRNARFVGGGNYLRLLQDPLFWKVMRNTLVFVRVCAACSERFSSRRWSPRWSRWRWSSAISTIRATA
jgi:multiple sugar transport system permease protein